VLLLRDPQIMTIISARNYFETDFASFLAWRTGAADKTVFNGFGMGALRGSDGVFLLGEMAAHTANHRSGLFSVGNARPNDLRGDRVDMADSVSREVAEETGLAPADYRAAVTALRAHRQWIAFMRALDVAVPAEELRRRILQNLAVRPSRS